MQLSDRNYVTLIGLCLLAAGAAIAFGCAVWDATVGLLIPRLRTSLFDKRGADTLRITGG